MESVLEFLESNDSTWSMNFDRYNNYIDVAEVFGYEFKSHKTRIQGVRVVDFQFL